MVIIKPLNFGSVLLFFALLSKLQLSELNIHRGMSNLMTMIVVAFHHNFFKYVRSKCYNYANKEPKFNLDNEKYMRSSKTYEYLLDVNILNIE